MHNDGYNNWKVWELTMIFPTILPKFIIDLTYKKKRNRYMYIYKYNIFLYRF